MGRGRATFVDVTRKSPCPVCGADGFCTMARDGKTVVCRRQETAPDGRRGKAGQDRLGARWTFYYGEREALPVAPVIAGPEVASFDVRARVYARMVDLMELAADHVEALRTRGLSAETIRANQYRTLRRGRARVAATLAREFGDVIAQVPGFYQVQKPGESPYWSIACASGMLVPVRSADRNIGGFQVRIDEPREARYVWLSSASHEGPGPQLACHVPKHTGKPQRVRLTEGPLKADVATALDPSGLLTLGVPGVGTWRCALPTLEVLEVREVLLAWDADWRTNRRVAASLLDACTTLEAAGYTVALEQWSTTGGVPKGIDDALLAGVHVEVRT